mmetsp:Transcript_54175/g.131468  ORF Transcript_54175/g.131468 Transcript_54175/m.131468 type:complete len:83 (-) Transcript_54175:812-1060(-)
MITLISLGPSSRTVMCILKTMRMHVATFSSLQKKQLVPTGLHGDDDDDDDDDGGPWTTSRHEYALESAGAADAGPAFGGYSG